MIKDVIQKTKARMEKAVKTFGESCLESALERASISLLDHIMVEYYGTPTP
jgi:ribosome recycling factor